MAEIGADRSGADTVDPRAFFRAALPEVYGFVLARCGDPQLAEDITSEAFLALARSRRQNQDLPFSVGWLIVVARNRLIDHWRQSSREGRRLRLIEQEIELEDTGVEAIDDGRLAAAFDALSSEHRAALSLRYLDDLSVPAVAESLGRSVHATESLLARARTALRRAYAEVDDD
jgi:RNA polymerase sigma-70 factor, ECF subfamily